MGPDVLVLGALALLSFFVRGLTGAASSIVFNALLAVLLALGLAGGLSLRTGLYWSALANAVATLLLLAVLARSIRPDRPTVLLLVGLLPTTIVFTLLLPHVDIRGLQLLLGIGVIFGGVQLLRGEAGLPMTLGPLGQAAAVLIGVVAGILSGLYGMGGPVLLVALGRWTHDPSEFRTRFTAITALANLIRVPVLLLAGVYGPDDVRLFVLTLPEIGIGLAAGFWTHRFVSARAFRTLLGAVVAVAGTLAVVEAL